MTNDVTLNNDTPLIEPTDFDLGITTPLSEGPITKPTLCVDFKFEDGEHFVFAISDDSITKLLDFVVRNQDKLT